MDKQLSVKLPPSLTAETSVKIWEQVLGAESSGQTIFDASDLTFCDESGLTLLYELRSRPDAFKLINVSASIETLYNTMLKNFSPKPVEKKSLGVVSSLGKWLYDAASSTKQSIIFLGSACCLSPMYFLVVPRLIASSLVVLLLSVFATILGILGGGLVMAMYDITYTQFYVQLLKSVTVTDIVFGLVKAVIFGFVIALIGCQCGMNTGAGAAAVGSSTTKSVVKSIIWIVVIDGAAALLTNRLGI